MENEHLRFQHFMPLDNHYDYLKKLECLKLQASFNEYQNPSPAVLDSISYKGANWRVNLPNSDSRIMYSEFGDMDNEFHVVHVSPEKFYYFWLLSSLYSDDKHRTKNCVLLRDMPKDYKFDRAALGFAIKDKPVPLAQLNAFYENNILKLAFNGGVTRTLWLLSQGVESFPIEVLNRETAFLIFEFFGTGEGPLSYQELKEMHNVKKPYYVCSGEEMIKMINQKDFFKNIQNEEFVKSLERNA